MPAHRPRSGDLQPPQPRRHLVGGVFPDGPYDDTEIAGGLLRYDYRAGTLQGDNTKLRRAWELEMPIILLRKIETAVYVPVFPTYVIADDQVNRQVVLAVDEQLRSLAPQGESVL